jgi:hypothetical protein
MSRPVTLLSEPAWCQPSVPAPVGRLNKRCDANAAVVGFRERRPVRERLRARSNSRRPDERFPNGIREPAFPLGHAGPPPASPRQRAPRSASPRPATLSKLRQPEVRDRRLPQTRAEQQSRRRRSCRRDAITGVPGGGGRNGACRARSGAGPAKVLAGCAAGWASASALATASTRLGASTPAPASLPALGKLELQ